MTNRTDVSPQTLLPVQVVDAQPNPAPSLLPVLACATLLLLAGCGAGKTITSGAVSTSTVVTGRVHGGQQAVVGATVTLYAPGTTGYGSPPTAIVSATTDSQGSFTLPRPYTCPANSPVTYIVATGGNPGAGNNASLALAALLPACSSLTASTFVWISEVTTVAAAYAFAPFASISGATTNIGTSSTNLLGLTNALGPATNLADTTTGSAKAATSITGLILPTAEINTLADILAACVNTVSRSIPSTACADLLTNATPPGSGSVAPNDTFQAAIDIALNPGNNAAALYALATPTAPFQPTLTSAPSDFAVGIRYNGDSITNGGIGIGGIDIDASGNAWVTAKASTPSLSNITEISPAGVYLSGSSGYLSGHLNFPTGIAIDNSDNAWIVNYRATTDVLAKLPLLNPAGATFSTPSSLAGSTGPVGIAVDNVAATTWIASWGGTTVSNINSSGLDATGSPYGSQDSPWSVAVDSSGNIWAVSNIADGFLTEFTPNAPGAPYTPHLFPTGTGTYPQSVAIDNSGDLWVTELTGLAKFSNAGAPISPAGGYGQNPYNGPAAVTIDGLGRAWVSNAPTDNSGNYLNPSFPPGSVTAFKPDGTLISTSTTDYTNEGGGLFTGYTAAGAMIQAPTTSIKVDPSGNLWISGNNPHLGEWVTELIGIAAPVVTPLSVASSTGKLGTRP